MIFKAGIEDDQTFKESQRILIEMGEYFQVQVLTSDWFNFDDAALSFYNFVVN